MDARPTSRLSYDRSAVVYVAVTLLLGIGSLHSQNNLLFLAFGVAVGVLLINGVYAWVSMRNLRVRRHLPARGEVGRPLTVRYHLTTRSRFFPAGGVVLEERDAPGECVGAAAIVTRDTPARAVGELIPTRRGELSLSRLDVSSRFPFGATKKSARFTQTSTVLVRPHAVVPDERSLLAAARGSSPVTVSLKRAGIGDEILGLREYSPGDPVRRIAWRASARHGGWLVREHAAQATGAVRIALDLDPALPEEANEEAISLAAGTLSLLRRRGQRATLCSPERPGLVIHGLAPSLDALARVDITRASRVIDSKATLVVEARAGGARLRASGRGALSGAGALA